MSGAVAVVEQEGGKRHFRFKRILIVGVSIVVVAAVSALLGWDIRGWFSDLWDTITGIGAGYLVAGAFFQTLQTFLKAIAWYWILAYAYGRENMSGLKVLAAYSASVALNGFLPANLGTLAMMFMFLTFVVGSTFPGVFTAYLVQKIFFTIIGTVVYLYLFLSVPGSFDVNLGNISAHPVATVVIVVGGAFLLVLLGRIFWRQVKKLWEQAKQGGVILGQPRRYLTRVFLPSLGSWLAKVTVIGIFLAAFAIPVTVESLMWIVGSGSLANVASFTPGAVGVTQATNALALDTCCNVPTDVTVAYSTAQQLIVTAWNVLFATVLVIAVFGWTGGKELVGGAYVDAKVRATEMKEARKRKKNGEQDGEDDEA
jgi:uncharacterized membrane protein YbhN (UPF0104 family)